MQNQNKVTKTPLKTLIAFIIVKKNLKNFFDHGVHYHDVLVDLVHFSEDSKMQISLKLEQY